MNPYAIVPNEPATEIKNTVSPQFATKVASMSGAALAGVGILCSSAAIIAYIDAKYQPNMGFWAVILIVITAMLSIPVCGVVFVVCKYFASRNFSAVPYSISAITCAVVMVLGYKLISSPQAMGNSLILTYGTLSLLITMPPSLFGFAVSGCIAFASAAKRG